MTRRKKRGALILLAIVAVLAAAEVGLNRLRGPEACVEVENCGSEPIENLVLSCGPSRVSVARVDAGRSVKVYVAARGVHTLSLRYYQKGNALGVFDLSGFDASQMSREGFKQVLKVRTNEVECYQDDAEPKSPTGWAVRNWWNNLGQSLEGQLNKN